jgi:CheY-like chemotaxis protein
VADPDAGIGDQCRSILRPIVPDIVYAEDGREALALAIAHRPRFVITATGLRFIDGYTLCSLLRAEPLTADVPIVVLTCDPTPAAVTLARSSGADRVVGTPYSPGALLQAVSLGRNRAWTAGDSAESIPCGSPASHLGLGGSVEPPAAPRRRFMVDAHRRFETSTPPIVPPRLSVRTAIERCSTSAAMSGALVHVCPSSGTTTPATARAARSSIVSERAVLRRVA